MNLRTLHGMLFLAALPVIAGCGRGPVNIVGDWEAVENGARLVEFRFGSNNQATIAEFKPGLRVAAPAGVAMIETQGPIVAAGQPYEAVSTYQYVLDTRYNPARLQLNGIGTDAGIELVYLVNNLTPQEIQLRLVAGPPGRPGIVRIGPEMLMLHRRR